MDKKQIVQELAKLHVIVDSREQKNQHITSYLNIHNIAFTVQKMNFADYTFTLPDIKPLFVERKNSLDELAQNFTKGRTRFANEFDRAGNNKTILMIENSNFCDIVNHRYRSKLTPKAYIASLSSFEAKYNISTSFVPSELAGYSIYNKFYYYAYQQLKNK